MGSEPVRPQLDATSWVDVHRGFVDPDARRRAVRRPHRRRHGLRWQASRLFQYDHYVDENRAVGAMWRPGTPAPHPALVEIHRRVRIAYGQAVRWARRSTGTSDGHDGQAFHRDRDMRWCEDTVIAILTLGATRPWLLRPRANRHDHDETRFKGATHDLAPASGDLLVMGGRCQVDWEHSVPQIRQPVEPAASRCSGGGRRSGAAPRSARSYRAPQRYSTVGRRECARRRLAAASSPTRASASCGLRHRRGAVDRRRSWPPRAAPPSSTPRRAPRRPSAGRARGASVMNGVAIVGELLPGPPCGASGKTSPSSSSTWCSMPAFTASSAPPKPGSSGARRDHVRQRLAGQLVLGDALLDGLGAGDRLHGRVDDLLLELHVRPQRRGQLLDERRALRRPRPSRSCRTAPRPSRWSASSSFVGSIWVLLWTVAGLLPSVVRDDPRGRRRVAVAGPAVGPPRVRRRPSPSSHAFADAPRHRPPPVPGRPLRHPGRAAGTLRSPPARPR